MELDAIEMKEGLDLFLKVERDGIRARLEELLLEEESYWRIRAKVEWAKK